MEEKEMNAKQLFDYINHFDGDFFIRLILTEEGDVRGQTTKRSSNSARRGATTAKRE